MAGQQRARLSKRRESLAAAASRRLQCVLKSRGASAADHLGVAGLIILAADGAVGARAAVAVRSATKSVCVLREFAAGLVADGLELFGGMPAQGNFAGQSRSADGKGANHDEENGETSHGSLRLCASPPEIKPTTF